MLRSILQTLMQQLKFHFDKLLDLRFGRYSAQAIMVISGPEKDIPVEATTSFFVFPWKLALIALVVILFTLLGIIITGRTIFKGLSSVVGKK